MLGLLVLFFFGVTGFTVNHEDWFGATTPTVTNLEGQTPPELIARNDALRIVESLRNDFHISGAMTDFDDLGDHYEVGFKNPGQNWDAVIQKAGGQTSVRSEAFNFFAVINNLHRGRYSGTAWKWIIDLCALLITLACATGFVLWLVLPHRRKLGLAAFALGTLGTLAIYIFLVPGADAPPPAPAPTPAAPAP
jgi:hypothetical protein